MFSLSITEKVQDHQSSTLYLILKQWKDSIDTLNWLKGLARNLLVYNKLESFAKMGEEENSKQYKQDKAG